MFKAGIHNTLVLILAICSLSCSSTEIVPVDSVQMTNVMSVAISPDGKMIATGGFTRHTNNPSEGILKLWNSSNGREIRTMNLPTLNGSSQSISSLVFSPDGKMLIAGGLNSVAIDSSTGKELYSLLDGHSQTGAAFSPDGGILAVPSNGLQFEMRGVKLYDAMTGRQTDLLPLSSPGQIYSVAFSPDGQYLATAGSDCKVTIWDIRKKSISFQDQIGWVLNCCSFTKDGRLLVCAGEGGKLLRYHIEENTIVKNKENKEDSNRYRGSTRSLFFSPDGMHLIVVNAGRIDIWDVAKWQICASFEGTSAAVTTSGKFIAVGNQDRGVVEMKEFSKVLSQSGTQGGNQNP